MANNRNTDRRSSNSPDDNKGGGGDRRGGRNSKRGNETEKEGGDSRIKVAETELKEKMVALNRVAKVTKGGRTFSFAAVVVVGDGNGTVGHGLGKAREVSEAISKAVDDAKKNLIKFPIYKGTIPHEQLGKYGAGKVLIKPASDGTGVIAGGGMRAVLEISGVQNVLCKSQGSSNPHNVIKATIDALSKLRSPMTVAKQRTITKEKLFNG
ncbi:MAG: 30S ribosomal protein S5 [Saprospiraceae bacterium]|nr:30S ribosomal protein S5 [Saprospiraceae bacterium]